MALKSRMTPEAAIEAFIRCAQNSEELPQEVADSIGNYRNWGENQLKGLLNASAYYPELLYEENMEKTILELLEGFKKRIVPMRIF
ncbi:MAG: hypothetical protein SFU98_06695 [Leptospiraceae bacterium]|nr:hypothetical protein [Leptospiraceae bacterium]